jgi:hypothetical protein
MEIEIIETTSPDNEEEPQIFSVAHDVNGNQFNRRDFIEKAVVTSAAVTVIATGCMPKATVSAAEVQAAIQATQNSQKLTELAPAPQTAQKANEPVAAPTQEPTNTATRIPTDTQVPSTPTLSPTPKPKGIESTIYGDNVNFRSGPGTGYSPITRLPGGTSITLVGRLADSSWVAVSLADPKKAGAVVNGWIKTNLVDTRGKDIQSLPIVMDIPPTPTPLPGKYGTTGAGQKGIDYKYTDQYGNVYNYTLPCGSAIPAGATCTCNCVTVPANCSCVDHTSPSSGGGGCTCDTVHYWYPN